MAFNAGVNHVLLLKGNLKTDKGILKLNIIHEGLKNHLWQISLHELTYKCRSPVSLICGISTNFVKDLMVNQNKEISNGHPILKQFILLGKANEVKLVRFEPTWFYVTNYEDQICLQISEINRTTNELVKNIDIDIFVSCILQRVK